MYLPWACFVHSNMRLIEFLYFFLSPKSEKRKILAHLWSWLFCVQLISLVGELSVIVMKTFWFLNSLSVYKFIWQIVWDLGRTVQKRYEKICAGKYFKKHLFKHFPFNILSILSKNENPMPFCPHTKWGHNGKFFSWQIMETSCQATLSQWSAIRILMNVESKSLV